MFRLSDQAHTPGARWGMGGGGLKGEASIVHFEPVNRTTVSGQIVDQIKSMVRSGNLLILVKAMRGGSSSTPTTIRDWV